MAKSTYYIESIVSILSENKKIGMAFVIQRDSEYTYLLTCKHVIFEQNEYKKVLSFRDENNISSSFNLPFDKNHITLCQGKDLALIKIIGLENQRACLLQKHQYDDNLIISTFSNIGKNNKDSFIHENIKATVEEKTFLNHGKNYAAFLLNVDEALESGYSGSPLYDHNTGHVIGVVNIKDGDSNAYAINIQEAKELIADLEITIFKDIPKKEFDEPIARIVFEHKIENTYKLSINQTELFNGESIDIFANKQRLIDEIYKYCYYLPTGEERESEIELVELVMPHNLFSKDIGLWESSENDTLFEVCGSGVLVRNVKKVEQAESKKVKSIQLWNKTVNKLKCFEEVSCGIADKFVKNSDVLSYYLESASHESTPFKKIVSNTSILVWINNCDDSEKYQKFLSDIKNQNLEEFPKKFRRHLTESSYKCGMNTNLMWDNPNTLPKAYYE